VPQKKHHKTEAAAPHDAPEERSPTHPYDVWTPPAYHANDHIFDGAGGTDGGGAGIFTRLGHFAYMLNTTNQFRGYDMPIEVDTLAQMYNSYHNSVVSGLYPAQDAMVASLNTFASYLQATAKSSLIDTALTTGQVTDSSFSTALSWLVNRMLNAPSGGDTVKSNAVTATVTPATSNHGNAVVVATVTGPNGVAQEYVFNETVIGTVTSDSQTGTAKPGQEGVTFKGAPAAPLILGYEYPMGSGASRTVSGVDPLNQQAVGGAANYLRNSSFELWTVPNTPDRWTIGPGTASLTVLQGTTALDGTSSLKFVGDGAELTAVVQPFNSSGSTVVVGPLKTLAFCLWYSRPGTVTAGALEVALVDGTGLPLNDAQGVANTATVTSLITPSADAGWVSFSGVFRTPKVMPPLTQFRVRLSSHLGTGEVLLIDRVALAEPTAVYAGGPAVAVFTGANKLIAGDTFTVAVTNDYGGALQTAADRFYGLRLAGLQLPSSTTPTILDSLVA
jgi:hypothetical protein